MIKIAIGLLLGLMASAVAQLSPPSPVDTRQIRMPGAVDPMGNVQFLRMDVNGNVYANCVAQGK